MAVLELLARAAGAGGVAGDAFEQLGIDGGQRRIAAHGAQRVGDGVAAIGVILASQRVDMGFLQAGEVRLVRTGIAIELPPNTEAQVRPRSGLALKHHVTVLNTPGTIDEGYRGEIGVILINHGRAAFDIVIGAKIAQLVVKPTLHVAVEEVDSLSSTERGTGGFGSTG